MPNPAFGDAMSKPPKIRYTAPPVSPSPSVSPRPGATPAPGAPATPTPVGLPEETPEPGASPSPAAAVPAGPRPAGPRPKATPNPALPGVSGPGSGMEQNTTPETDPFETPEPETTQPPPEAYEDPDMPEDPTRADLPEPSPSPEGTPSPKVKVQADALRSDRARGVHTFRGNVRVNYGQMGITSEELSVDQKAQEVFTDTKFTLTQPDPKKPGETQVITGTGMRYNYETKEAVVNGANLSTPAEYPGQTIYIRTKTLQTFGETRFEGYDAVFSTCSELLEEKVPHYHVETKRLQYFAGDKIVAWDNKIYLNGRYVFWLPVWVIPLKGERNDLNIGRTEVEGFFIRGGYSYALPSLNNGFWLNDGRLLANMFEKKGPGLGFEHTARWGYDASTYGFFYGLVQPDRSNLLPVNPNPPLTTAQEDQLVSLNQKLFDLSGTYFQDRQFGIEHKQRLFGDMEIGGRFEDHNIYDPLSFNVRTNRRTTRLDLKDRVEGLGGLSYDVGYDSTEQRGTQVPTAIANMRLSPSVTDRVRGNTAFKVGNTDFRFSSQADRTHQRTRELEPRAAAGYSILQNNGGTPVEYDVITVEGATNTNVTNNVSASTTWGPETRSSVTVPYRVQIQEPAPVRTPRPGAPVAPTPTATPTPTPWDQQAEPQIEFSHRVRDIGTVSVQAQKFVDITEPLSTTTPQQLAQRARTQNKFDRLPEITLTSEPLLQQWQPVTAKVGYGRFFEYASIDPAAFANAPSFNRFWPGQHILRLNPEVSLNSKAHPIGFRSQLDFSGTGYRQFFYSTKDAQYSIDERVRLVTNWTKSIQTNFNYTNNVTPDRSKIEAEGSKAFNNSPFQQDKISLGKQTRLTGSLDIRNDPFLAYALRGGYDYQNLLYDNITSEITWRSSLLGFPMGLTLNGGYDPEDTPYLKFESKRMMIRYIPEFPTWGIAGKWTPVSGTFTLRSTPEIFGGQYGSDNILPGWQFDNSLAYDFNTGLWTSLVNRLYITFGNDWRSHVQLMLGGYYDVTDRDPANRNYKFSQIGITKDLHDFVLSFQYDRLASFYSLSLTMVAFPSQPLNFTSNTFNRRSDAGGANFGNL